MPIAGIVFDLGHTLMHLDGTWPEIFERGAADLAAFLAAHRPDLDGEALARSLLERRREGFAQARKTMREVTAEESICWVFARFGVSDPEPALVRGAIEAYFAYEDRCWCADPQALPVLSELADRGLRLGMFSNASDDRFIQRLVDRFGFRPFLEPALSSAGTGFRKPDEAALMPILAAWDLPPESVLMVGDTLEEDILGAKRAGMPSVWIRSRKDARQERDDVDGERSEPIEPNMTIEGLGELPSCLQKL